MPKQSGKRSWRRRAIPWGLPLLCVLLLLWWWRPETSFDLASIREAARGRDVALITLDTTRYDHLGCYGYGRDTSPALDRLASEGIRFKVAYASAPVTLPAHATILTGQHPPRHGVRNNARYELGDKARTLAELLRASGYQTAAFVSALVLDSRHGLAQGFDHYGDDLSSSPEEPRFVMAQRDAGAVIEEALGWLRRRDRTRPAFVWLHFFEPHHPWSPPPQLARKYGSEELDLYDAEIRAMDDALGQFRERAVRDGFQPLWAILSDHGEGLKDHGETAHGSFVYDTTTRIAFILSGRGILPPHVSSAVAQQVDLLPTLLDLLGIALPRGLDGRSLLGTLDVNDGTTEVYTEALLGHEEYGWSPVFGLVRNGWKYIEAPRPELYDLSSDPHELTNLIAGEPRRADAMRRALRPYMEGKGGEAAERLILDPGHREALLSLGYTTGGGLTLPTEDLPDPKDMLDVWNEVVAARSMLQEGPHRDPLGAFARLEKVLRKNPANGEALRLLGRGAWREAKEHPHDANRETYLNYSRRAFEQLGRRAPDQPESEFGFGVLAMLREDAPRAIAHFERALEMDPRHLESLQNLMRISHKFGEWRKTCERAARVLAIDDNHREAMRLGALSHYRLEENLRAIPLLLALLPARDPAEGDGVHFYLGECYRKTGRYHDALTHYGKVREPVRTAEKVPAFEDACRKALESRRP